MKNFFKALRGSGNLLKNEDFTIEHDIIVSVKRALDFNQKKLVRNSEKTETLYYFHMPHTFPPKKSRSPYQSFMISKCKEPIHISAATSSSLCDTLQSLSWVPTRFSLQLQVWYSCSFLQDQTHNNTSTWDMAILTHMLMLNPAWFGVIDKDYPLGNNINFIPV